MAFAHVNEIMRARWEATFERRFWARVLIGDGCWLWTGNTYNGGYGFVTRGGKQLPAHRFTYEALIGPIPAGLEIDHLCRKPRCVRPDHLEPVTHLENMLRGARFRTDLTPQVREYQPALQPPKFTPIEIGDRFTRLTVTAIRHVRGQRICTLLCDCGTERELRATKLLIGQQSCGCLAREQSSQRLKGKPSLMKYTDRCRRGHDLTLPDAWYIIPRTGARTCHQCIRERDQRVTSDAQFEHGFGGYTNYRCRCEICRTAARAYMREYRQRQRT